MILELDRDELEFLMAIHVISYHAIRDSKIMLAEALVMFDRSEFDLEKMQKLKEKIEHLWDSNAV